MLPLYGCASLDDHHAIPQAVITGGPPPPPPSTTKCPNGDDIVRSTTPLRVPLANLWCWAASAEMAMTYVEPNVPHLQCKQANEALPRTDCCDIPPPPECDQAGGGIPPLAGFSSLASTGALSTNAIFAEICTAKRPFLILMPAAGGGGHMMTVVGYEEDDSGSGELLIVHNPWMFGKVDVSFLTVKRYQAAHKPADQDYYSIKKGPQ